MRSSTNGRPTTSEIPGPGQIREALAAKPADGVESTAASREVHLVIRPSGMPMADDFSLVWTTLPKVQDRQVMVRNLFMSVDPYMRGRMNDGASYIPAFALGKALAGGAVGVVIESRAAGFEPGDVVTSNSGWREKSICWADELHPVGSAMEPVSIHLGLLGMTGMTAWAGLKLLEVRPGEVVFISGAAGAVGNVAGQLAKQRGCRVIGCAGTDAKVAFLLKECGFDAAFNYRNGAIPEQLLAAAPRGIDVYFDNVGGGLLEHVLAAMSPHGRIIACGGISTYNEPHPHPGPTNLFLMTTRRLTMKGFIVRDILDQRGIFEQEMRSSLASGRIRSHETVVKGIDRAVQAFIGLFSGDNVGKMIVDLR